MDLGPLVPYAEKLLYGGAILLLIALLGGAQLHIRDLQLGPLGPVARGLAAVTGVLLFIGFLVVAQRPMPPPTFAVNGKVVVGIFRELAGKVEEVGISPPEDKRVGWFRSAPRKKAPVEPDGGYFVFPPAEAIEEGTYEFTIYFKNQAEEQATVTISKDQLLLIVSDDGGTYQVRKDPITYFRGRYTGFWAKKVQAIEHLSDLDQRNPNIHQRLIESYKSGGDQKELAMWALGDACRFEVKPELEAIYEGLVDQASEFDKLRAGFQLTCFPDHIDVFDDFYRRLLRPLPEGADTRQRILRRLAAFYLLKRDHFERCVLKELIDGRSFPKEDAQDMVNIMLANKLNWRDEYQDDHADPLTWDRQKWRAWFDRYEDDLPPCGRGNPE